MQLRSALLGAGRAAGGCEVHTVDCKAAGRAGVSTFDLADTAAQQCISRGISDYL